MPPKKRRSKRHSKKQRKASDVPKTVPEIKRKGKVSRDSRQYFQESLRDFEESLQQNVSSFQDSLGLIQVAEERGLGPTFEALRSANLEDSLRDVQRTMSNLLRRQSHMSLDPSWSPERQKEFLSLRASHADDGSSSETSEGSSEDSGSSDTNGDSHDNPPGGPSRKPPRPDGGAGASQILRRGGRLQQKV